MNNITAKLDELASMQATVDATRIDYEKKRSEILKTVQNEIDALDAEFQPMIESSQSRIAALEAEIRDAVLHHGASVKGKSLIAFYSRGRVSWDREAMDNYAKSHPEIGKFRKEGQPFVSLRTVKQ